MNSKFSFIIDLITFQIAWFLCVLAIKTPFPKISPFIALVIVFTRTMQVGRFRLMIPFIVSSLIIGIIGDATLVQLGLLQFQSYPNIFGSPLWMIALWACFGTMLRPLFSWFLDHCWRSILGFSIGGVVAYWSGQKLGVLEFSNSWVSALGIAGEWAIAGTVLRFLHLKFPEPSKE